MKSIKEEEEDGGGTVGRGRPRKNERSPGTKDKETKKQPASSKEPHKPTKSAATDMLLDYIEAMKKRITSETAETPQPKLLVHEESYYRNIPPSPFDVTRAVLGWSSGEFEEPDTTHILTGGLTRAAKEKRKNAIELMKGIVFDSEGGEDENLGDSNNNNNNSGSSRTRTPDSLSPSPSTSSLHAASSNTSLAASSPSISHVRGRGRPKGSTKLASRMGLMTSSPSSQSLQRRNKMESITSLSPSSQLAVSIDIDNEDYEEDEDEEDEDGNEDESEIDKKEKRKKKKKSQNSSRKISKKKRNAGDDDGYIDITEVGNDDDDDEFNIDGTEDEDDEEVDDDDDDDDDGDYVASTRSSKKKKRRIIEEDDDDDEYYDDDFEDNDGMHHKGKHLHKGSSDSDSDGIIDIVTNTQKKPAHKHRKYIDDNDDDTDIIDEAEIDIEDDDDDEYGTPKKRRRVVPSSPTTITTPTAATSSSSSITTITAITSTPLSSSLSASSSAALTSSPLSSSSKSKKGNLGPREGNCGANNKGKNGKEQLAQRYLGNVPQVNSSSSFAFGLKKPPQHIVRSYQRKESWAPQAKFIVMPNGKSFAFSPNTFEIRLVEALYYSGKNTKCFCCEKPSVCKDADTHLYLCASLSCWKKLCDEHSTSIV